MRILTAESMAAVDRRAIAGGIPGLTLMENAGKGAAGAILRGFPDARSAVILCGQGNNGGDGYVAARHLQTAGWRVQVFVLAVPGSVRGDALHNLELLDPGCVQYCTSRAEMQRIGEELSAADLGVDAIFGTGLRKPVEGVQREAVQALNTCGKPVVALDIPSGVEASSGRILGCAVRADLTVTFAAAKVGHLLYPGAEQTGELRVLDIGIPPYMLEEAEGYEFLDLAAAARLLRRRRRTDHKGTFGHCLLLAGAPGTTGAASMSANSAVRAGAGLVTVAVPQGVHAVLEVKTTEAMTVPLPEAEGGLAAEAWPSVCALLAGKSAVVVGPGLGRRAGTAELVRRVVRGVEAPLLLDADGLNAVAEDPEVLRERKGPTVLTPHPGEMSRLCGLSVERIEEDRLGTAGAFATRYGVHLVLKGARTVIVSPDGSIAVNGSGNPGMASGGTGDVLAGVIGALLAQGYPPPEACRLGVFAHGLAGDLVAVEKGEIGMSAVDVQEALPYAFRKILESKGATC